MAPKTVREYLYRILALVEGGWVKNRSMKRRGDRVCYCISGAFHEATKSAPSGEALIVWRAIQDATPFGGDPISYNDDAGRKKSDIVRVLNYAIVRVGVGG